MIGRLQRQLPTAVRFCIAVIAPCVALACSAQQRPPPASIEPTSVERAPDTAPTVAAIEAPEAAVSPATDAALLTSATEPDAAIAPDSGVLALPAAVVERFPIVPMHLVPAPGATGEDARVDLELRADGTLHSHGRLIAQISGDRVVASDGRELLSVTPEGAVRLNGTPTQIRILETGAIALPSGATLSFADDGAPMMSVGGQPARRGPSTVQGFVPSARRTADLLAIIVATVALPR